LLKNQWIYYIKKLAFLFLCSLFLLLYYFSSRNVSQSKALIYPNFVMGALGIAILWNIIGTIFETKKELSKLAEERKSLTSGSWKHYKKRIIIFVSAVIFIFISQILGFWISTFLYIFLLSYYLGMKNLKYSIPQSIITTAVIYGLFALWLNLDLPKGFLF